MAQLDQSLHHCVLEATGNYGVLLVELLIAAELAVSVVNPRQIKYFVKAMHHITKTDKVDAQLIALYGAKMEPRSYQMPVASIQALKQQKTVLSQLKKQLTMSYNLLDSFSVLPKTDAVALKMTKQTIAYLKEQIVVLEQQMLSIRGHVRKRQIKHVKEMAVFLAV
ncbi:IS110 family transposase [Candidatus Cardinium sp. TP]|uniref:IS110 family transposase n=1 Tax=Candidatus Cardinium sp. TP TaxID=2961955 RepID=UPI0021AF3783|nr:transposase [Candidatus Cardinium sp. TP]MCT4697362.1 transposase [Candidatus Cardinium sp. TP]